MRRRFAIGHAAMLFLSCGCQIIPMRAGRDRRDLILRADALVLHHERQRSSCRLTSSEVISGFRDLYESLKWVDYWHTVPSELNRRTIELFSGETRLAHFSLLGFLWERSDTGLKTARLTVRQDAWLDGLFDNVADGDLDTRH